MKSKIFNFLNSFPTFQQENLFSTQQNSIPKTLDAVFAYNAAGLDGKSKYDNLHPLVEFAYHYSIQCNASIARDAPALPICYSLFESLLNELTFEKNLLSELKENPTHSTLIKIYLLLLNNWNSLKNLQTTYRLLSAMSELETDEHRQDSEEAKLQLDQILRLVMKDWQLKKALGCSFPMQGG